MVLSSGKKWEEEKLSYLASNGRGTAGAGHYTQLVWAETSRLGCGYRYFKVGDRSSILVCCIWYIEHFVCGYRYLKVGNSNSMLYIGYIENLNVASDTSRWGTATVY